MEFYYNNIIGIVVTFFFLTRVKHNNHIFMFHEMQLTNTHRMSTNKTQTVSFHELETAGSRARE